MDRAGRTCARSTGTRMRARGRSPLGQGEQPSPQTLVRRPLGLRMTDRPRPRSAAWDSSRMLPGNRPAPRGARSLLGGTLGSEPPKQPPSGVPRARTRPRPTAAQWRARERAPRLLRRAWACAAAQASLLPARGFSVACYGVWAASGERPVLTGGGSPGSSQLPAGGGQMHRALFPAPAVRAAACRTRCSDGALISPSRARAGTVVSVGERECTATPIPLTFLIRCIYVREKACLPACWCSSRGPRSGSPSLSALPRGLRGGHLGDRPAGPQSRRRARRGCAHRPPGSPESWSHHWSSGPVPLPSAHLDTEPQRPVHSPDSV